MDMTINTSSRPAVMPVAAPETGAAEALSEVHAQAAATVASLVDACVQIKESRAKAREMLAKAHALEAKAALAEMKEALEDFIRELEEKIRWMEKLLTKEGDDVQAEEHLEENVAAQIAESIEEMSEEAEKLVAGFETRREEIWDEKRGIEA